MHTHTQGDDRGTMETELARAAESQMVLIFTNNRERKKFKIVQNYLQDRWMQTVERANGCKLNASPRLNSSGKMNNSENNSEFKIINNNKKSFLKTF